MRLRAGVSPAAQQYRQGEGRMTTSSTVMDDRRVERIVHEALGRQLRTTSLLALLLGILGFFAGHFVAASYSRQRTGRGTAMR